ncbi:hypothetical protein HOA56_00515 [archaeon]|nr:hypothetical protein [archaeon]MBT6820885.1 hypothetical protein [archaeon]
MSDDDYKYIQAAKDGVEEPDGYFKREKMTLLEYAMFFLKGRLTRFQTDKKKLLVRLDREDDLPNYLSSTLFKYRKEIQNSFGGSQTKYNLENTLDIFEQFGTSYLLGYQIDSGIEVKLNEDIKIELESIISKLQEKKYLKTDFSYILNEDDEKLNTFIEQYDGLEKVLRPAFDQAIGVAVGKFEKKDFQIKFEVDEVKSLYDSVRNIASNLYGQVKSQLEPPS